MPSTGDAVQRAGQLLHRRFKVELKDGRQLEGDFQCLDKQGNLVLSNSCELIENPLSKQSERQMGMVLIPKAYQVKVQVKGTLAEKMSLMALAGASS